MRHRAGTDPEPGFIRSPRGASRAAKGAAAPTPGTSYASVGANARARDFIQ